MSSPKTSKALYRDLLRLTAHVAGSTSPKAIHMRRLIADQFRQNKDISDPVRLHALKSSAERGLSNYLIFMNSKTDPKVAAAAADLGTFEDDEQGNLVKVVEARIPAVQYPFARVSKEQQAKGELPAGKTAGPRPTVGVKRKAGGGGGGEGKAR